MQCTVAAGAYSTVLVERVRLIHGRGRRAGGHMVRADTRVQHILRNGARHVHNIAARGRRLLVRYVIVHILGIVVALRCCSRVLVALVGDGLSTSRSLAAHMNGS